jgi:hypothetical protein
MLEYAFDVLKNMGKVKNNIIHSVLFAMPGILFLISGIRFYLADDIIGMVINCIAGISFFDHCDCTI